MAKHDDTYRTITEQIVADLERGVRPWAPSWNRTKTLPLTLPRRSTGELYRGANILLLWMAAARNGFSSDSWLTFNQAKTVGASVRKGEKATHVLFFDRFTKEDTREGHEGESRSFAFARTYAVFNADQIEGLPAPFGNQQPSMTTVPAGEFFVGVGADVRHGGSQPMYVPSADYIRMPRPEDFRSPEAYVSTLGHEHVHWTGHTSRLGRSFDRFGTEAYAVEELVAEIGSAFLCATLGVANCEREDHAAYVAHYLDLLRGDSRLFVQAASAAQKSVDFLHERAGARAVAAGAQASVAAA
jgi:antirestriction protein ArdC